MIIKEFKSRLQLFPKDYNNDFDNFFLWKIKVESNSLNHILDDEHIDETFRRLCEILPRWQTYRNGQNSNSLDSLYDSLANIKHIYDQIRFYSLLNFNEVPYSTLETIWHELGRVKEKDGNRNDNGHYSTIAVCKPLMLLWGQTLAFDSKVRKHMPKISRVSRYSYRWYFRQWNAAMKYFSQFLQTNREFVVFITNEAKKRYSKDTNVPYGRFLDMYYWVGC